MEDNVEVSIEGFTKVTLRCIHLGMVPKHQVTFNQYHCPSIPQVSLSYLQHTGLYDWIYYDTYISHASSPTHHVDEPVPLSKDSCSTNDAF